MSDNSRIEWTSVTWNFLLGCTKISDGCLKCYIERTPPFRMVRRRFDKSGIGGTTGVTLHPDRLDWPLTRWKAGRRIFVNSLSDVFHDQVPDRFIADAFAVMAVARQHTFQMLTKRHARMRSLLSSLDFQRAVGTAIVRLGDSHSAWRYDERRNAVPAEWPLPNLWVGASVENQQWANIRVPALLATPATVRWLSCEPLLGPINLRLGQYAMPFDGETYGTSLDGINWVVCGGESGPGAPRPMDLTWAAGLVRQCQAAGVPVFVKQLGSAAGRHHHDIDTFPEELRVREYPAAAGLAASVGEQS